MNNKIFIAVSVLLAFVVSVAFGYETLAPAAVPDTVVMGNVISTTQATEAVMSKDEILAYISDSLANWEAGNTSAEMVIAELEEFLHEADEEIITAAKDGIALVIVETDSRILFDEAERQYASGNYIAAIRSILDISPSFSGWSKCSEMLISCKQKLADAVSSVVSIEDFEAAIASLDEYLELVDDDTMSRLRQELSHRLASLRDIASIIENAAELYENSDYAGAFSTISDGSIKYPDAEEITALFDEYRRKFIDSVAEKVHALCEEKQYNQALSAVDKAIETLDCAEFDELREYVREEKSFLYRFKKSFQRKFRPFF